MIGRNGSWDITTAHKDKTALNLFADFDVLPAGFIDLFGGAFNDYSRFDIAADDFVWKYFRRLHLA